MEQRFDAIIAGGGIAGSTSAAALARLGLKVLICEAGLPNERRLAGELVHPPVLSDLYALGLLAPLRGAGGFPVYGFALFRGADDEGLLLGYSEISGGRPASIAVEHARMTRALLDATASQHNVTLWYGARVLTVDDEGDTPRVTVCRAGVERQLSCRLVVSAEGRGAKLRRRAGIEVERGQPSWMVGYKLAHGRLPYPGYGHLFIGGPSVTLAYQISRTEVRVMFETGPDRDVPRDLLAPLPRPFRDDVERGIADGARQTAKVFGLQPERSSHGNVAVVGDAGGCVHPLTASGIAFCTGDPMRLARAVEGTLASGLDVELALRRYERARARPMRTRTALGPALVDTLSGTSPGSRLLRRGLFRYLARSPRGRAASLALLSTRQSSSAVMAREYAAVLMHALASLRDDDGDGRPSRLLPAVAELALRGTSTLRQML
ncbi:MAG: FAD-dependent monooxygenase [Myxococcales bacterium]|nr:FAD-dependent monooxygenase [Myxococcales bacterium]